jgi:hypothetical protein
VSFGHDHPHSLTLHRDTAVFIYRFNIEDEPGRLSLLRF